MWVYRHAEPPTHSKYIEKKYILNGQVSGNLTCTIATKRFFYLPTAWAPSVFGAVWFCRWVVTHSLCGFQLPWPPSCCLHHTEHPFAFIGRLEQIRLSPAYLESVRLNPSSPVLLTRNGPLRIFDTLRSLPWIFKKFSSKNSYSHRFKVWEKAEVI